VPATTATSARKAVRCTWRWTRSGICRPSTSRPPASKSGPRCGHWLRKSST
jgi:hypothetical protein